MWRFQTAVAPRRRPRPRQALADAVCARAIPHADAFLHEERQLDRLFRRRPPPAVSTLETTREFPWATPAATPARWPGLRAHTAPFRAPIACGLPPSDCSTARADFRRSCPIRR